MTDWRREAGFGIYMHWPFCAAKCPYCDFNSHVSAEIDHDVWRDAYLTEIARAAERLPEQIVHSIYFGGGTPSLMPPGTVGAIIEAICRQFRIANDLEVTLEANPGSVEVDRFIGYRAAGVNRVSLGVQAFNDHDLRLLGRIHSAADARAALATAFGTFDRVSFDLIYGRQGQSLEEWSRELAEAIELQKGHLSLYQLSIEPGTVFARRASAGKLPGLPNDDKGADFYELTVSTCRAAGLENYEVSNFAAPGQRSRHNLIYWKGGDYLGIGPGAHGRESRDGQRVATLQPRAPSAWLSAVAGGTALRETPLGRNDQLVEYLLMGLRLRGGVPVQAFLDMGGRMDGPGWEEMQALGMIEIAAGQLRASDQGRLLLNSVLAKLEI